MNLDDARKQIKKEKPFVNVKPYSHNIIGLVLSQVANENGYDAANGLIEEFGLEELGWKKEVKT